MSERPYGCMVWERDEQPDAVRVVSDDAFHHFEVLPLDHYTGGAYEMTEQFLEQSLPGIVEKLVDEAITEGHREFAVVSRIPWRNGSVR